MATYFDCIDDIGIDDINIIPTGYRQCQTNSSAPRVIKYFITVALNHVRFLDKFQIETSESEGIAF